MKALIVAAALLLFAPVLASAQDGSPKYRGQAYVFIGLGQVSLDPGYRGIGHVGGGGEFNFYKGLAVAGELGAVGMPGDGACLFSVGPSYHFQLVSKRSKFDPFVSGGYTRAFGNGGVNLMNFGGGVNYWLFKRVSLRLDLR